MIVQKITILIVSVNNIEGIFVKSFLLWTVEGEGHKEGEMRDNSINQITLDYRVN